MYKKKSFNKIIMLFYRASIYFVLFVLLTSIFFVAFSGKTINLPKSIIFKNDDNKNNINKNNLLISMILSLFITIIFIYKKENNL